MRKPNNRTSISKIKLTSKVKFSRNEIICRLSALSGLTSFQCAVSKKTEITSPSLLISSSDKQADPSNRFSFFCCNPSESKIFHDQHSLDEWQYQLPSLPSSRKEYSEIPFHSGWLGYFAYSSISNLNTEISDDKSAIAEFNYYPWVICFDHFNSTLNLLGEASELAIDLFNTLRSNDRPASFLARSDTNLLTTQGFRPLWDKNDYNKAFNSVQDYLKSGDCYQINLTQAYKSLFQGSPASLLPKLFQQMKPNFGGYFKGLNVDLISLSPERFISVNASGRLEAKPIKGTIKRSSDAAADLQLISELSHSSKNKAENLMIVDLLRNDLSKSALPGSVKVEALFELESHPNVHHLVSTISAQLKPGITPAIAISQAFPGGSITGAPKIRAMEIIEELEAEPRSLYCGSLGYFSDSGHSDFNILIRNLEFRNGIVTCWGGGGITVDSEAEDEYQESITKIKRIMELVEEQNPNKP